MKKSDEARFLKKIHGVEIVGKRGSKMRFFGIFSKTALTISFFSYRKRILVIRNFWRKPHVWEKSGSGPRGQKVPKLGKKHPFENKPLKGYSKANLNPF